jgi:hypothetical protein
MPRIANKLSLTIPDYDEIRAAADTAVRNELGAIARTDDRIVRAAEKIRQADAEIALHIEDRNSALASLYFHDLYEGAHLGLMAGITKNAVREIQSMAVYGDPKRRLPARMTDEELQAIARKAKVPHIKKAPGATLRNNSEIIEAARARRRAAVVFMRNAALALSEEPYNWDGGRIAEHAGVAKRLIWQQQATARKERDQAAGKSA